MTIGDAFLPGAERDFNGQISRRHEGDNTSRKMGKQKKAKHYWVIPEKVVVTSTTDYIPRFSMAEHLGPECPEIKEDYFQLTFSVVPKISRPTQLHQKFHYYYIAPNQKEIYCERSFAPGMTIQMHIQGMEKNPSIIVNNKYYKFVRFTLGVIPAPGRHLLEILTTRFLQQNILPLHCSSVSYKGNAFILFAAPDTGKTYTALTLRQSGFRVVTEDMAITDTIKIWGCPFTGTFYHLLSGNRSLKERVTKFYGHLVHRLPILARIFRPPVTSLWDYLQGDVEISASLRGIFFLQRSQETQIKELSFDEAFHRARISNRIEFTYDVNPMLLAYAAANPELDLDALRRKEIDLLKQLLQAYPIFFILASDYTSFPKLVEEAVEKIL